MLARTTVSAATLLLLSSTSVFAQGADIDAEAFAERLVAVAAEQGIPITYESAEADGETVTLTGFQFDDAAGADDSSGDPASDAGSELGGEPIDVTFEGVSGSDEEGWYVETIPFDDIDQTEEDTRVQITGMAINGLELIGTSPSEDTPAVKQLSPLYFESIGLGGVTVEEGGSEVFTLSEASVTNVVSDAGAFASAFDFGTFNVDLTAAPADDQGTQVLRGLGYDTLSGQIAGEAAWDPESGVLSLDPFSINLDEAGSLSFTYAISGYTPQFIESLKETQAQMAANPEDSSASGMAMMGLVSQLYLDSAVLSYEDASLANKLLDFFAEQNGQSRDEFVGGLSQMVPMMLAALNNPEFQSSVESAVATFLADPQNISISIEPATPVPATQIIGAAMGAPQTLPSVLQVEVTANDAAN